MIKIISTKNSSQRYGNCEKCGEYCAEVFHIYGWNGNKYIDTFGHKTCLEYILKKEAKNE